MLKKRGGNHSTSYHQKLPIIKHNTTNNAINIIYRKTL